MLLSKKGILRHLKAGNIVIDPFNEANLGSCSYDVSLGRHYFREGAANSTFYNFYSQREVRRVWSTFIAQPLQYWLDKYPYSNQEKKMLTDGIDPQDLVIWLAPGETILGHTQEFIGGRRCVTAMMKARSSIGRNFLTVCRCAGWGDVGYINRWTMEITNNNRHYRIPLVVGRRLAQMAFFEVEPIGAGDEYAQQGKYQTSAELADVKKLWQPSDMLPKMWKDREVAKNQKLETGNLKPEI